MSKGGEWVDYWKICVVVIMEVVVIIEVVSNFELFCEKMGEFVVLSWEYTCGSYASRGESKFWGSSYFLCAY